VKQAKYVALVTNDKTYQLLVVSNTGTELGILHNKGNNNYMAV
jgi:hypothetical protein